MGLGDGNARKVRAAHKKQGNRLMKSESPTVVSISCGAVPAGFLDRLGAASSLPGCPLVLLPQCSNIAELILQVAHQKPRFALFDASWLREESLGLLQDLRTASHGTLCVIVAPDLPNLTLAQALRTGLRGLLSPLADPDSLRRAFEVMEAGELWISRRRLLEILCATDRATDGSSHDTWRNLPALTEREHAVLREILAGKPNKLIARDLDLSEHTVKVHLQHIYQKLGVHRRMDLVQAVSGQPS
jgi:two-component system nitrate/nitrite response regulator NarL